METFDRDTFERDTFETVTQCRKPNMPYNPAILWAIREDYNNEKERHLFLFDNVKQSFGYIQRKPDINETNYNTTFPSPDRVKKWDKRPL